MASSAESASTFTLFDLGAKMASFGIQVPFHWQGRRERTWGDEGIGAMSGEQHFEFGAFGARQWGAFRFEL